MKRLRYDRVWNIISHMNNKLFLNSFTFFLFRHFFENLFYLSFSLYKFSQEMSITHFHFFITFKQDFIDFLQQLVFFQQVQRIVLIESFFLISSCSIFEVTTSQQHFFFFSLRNSWTQVSFRFKLSLFIFMSKIAWRQWRRVSNKSWKIQQLKFKTFYWIRFIWR